VAVGHFKDPDGGLLLVDISELDGGCAVGFYTTRVVNAVEPRSAIEAAADEIFEELSTVINKRQNRVELEIESCEEISGERGKSSSKGFSFFSEG
jgi:hypothetical protein